MPAIIYWAVPGFVLLLLLELAWCHWRGSEAIKGYATADTFASLAMGLGNLLTAAIWKVVAVAVLFAAYEFRLFEIPVDTWWAWALVIVGDDLCYYWFHRFGHRVRIGWAAHVNHHSSEHYNLSTALRQSWTGPILKVWFFVPLVLIGFHPLLVVTAQALNLLYQFWIHTEAIKRLPTPLEWLFNTPSHHRVHHGSNPQYLDKNYAGIFIVWDRLFGSFEPEIEPVRYGLTKSLGSFNPIKIAFHEWVSMTRHAIRAKRWKNKILYFLMPPDWDPKEPDEPVLHLQS